MTSSSSSSAQAGAMNLLEKYTSLNRGMDEARRENTRIQSEKESIRLQIESLQEERATMQAATTEARDETGRLHKDVQDALAQYARLEDVHAQALLDKTEACRQLEFAKNYVEEQRRDFLSASRDFRTTCKRMRLSASAVGEDTASTKAFLERHHVLVDGNDYDVDSTNDREEEDSELQDAMAKHARQRKAQEEAELVLETVRARAAKSSERSARRLERKTQLLAQLERIRKDNASSENKLRDLDEQTKEARELSHNYEKDLSRRMAIQQRGHSSFDSVPTITPPTSTGAQSQQQRHQSRPRNPYGRSNNGRDRSSNAVSAAPVGNWNLNDAQPHLNRRRRVDRQFGEVALDISRGSEMGGENDEVPVRPPRADESTATPSLQGAMNTTSRSILLDSDDEDDDELLNYSVFSKK